MNDLLLGMLKNLMPSDGDYRIQFGTHQDGTGKLISIQIGDTRTPDRPKLIAMIDITLPK